MGHGAVRRGRTEGIRLLRRVGIRAALASAGLAIAAPAAFAHYAIVTYHSGAGGPAGSCGNVTFQYYDFASGTNHATETGAINGVSLGTATVTWSDGGANSLDFTDTEVVPAGTGGERLTASTSWTASQTSDGNSGSATLTGQPVTIQCAGSTSEAPTVTLTTPPSPPATYYQGEIVPVAFSCTPGPGTTLKSCTSTAGPNGTPIDTSTLGSHCVTATGTDADNESASVTHCYNVVALTYTGRAYDAFVGLLGTLQLVGPINDTGAVSTTSTSFDDTHTVIPTSGLLTSFTLVSGVKTKPGNSTGTASVEATNDQPTTLNLGGGAPLLTVVAVESQSRTSCNAGSRSSTGSTTIAYLKIGTTLVVGPAGSGALVPAGTIAPNTSVLNVPGIASLVLNEQTPITDGLAVNAIHLKVLAGLSLLDVVVSHAESDLHGCSAVTG